jgi:hypothetical protein
MRQPNGSNNRGSRIDLRSLHDLSSIIRGTAPIGKVLAVRPVGSVTIIETGFVFVFQLIQVCMFAFRLAASIGFRLCQ